MAKAEILGRNGLRVRALQQYTEPRISPLMMIGGTYAGVLRIMMSNAWWATTDFSRESSFSSASQALGLDDRQPAILLPAAVARLLRHAQRLANLRERLPLGLQHLGLSQLRDDLLR
ncbi:MAG: hypothetical protein JSV80_08205 [Acidobacteriota bacterium]|nr:MAG: hypothetical protein JSV80_08205 [Acidobacteriota bacterium]